MFHLVILSQLALWFHFIPTQVTGKLTRFPTQILGLSQLFQNTEEKGNFTSDLYNGDIDYAVLSSEHEHDVCRVQSTVHQEPGTSSNTHLCTTACLPGSMVLITTISSYHSLTHFFLIYLEDYFLIYTFTLLTFLAINIKKEFIYGSCVSSSHMSFDRL